MTSFIPHETKILNDRETPWINNKVKTMIQKKKRSKIYQIYLKISSTMLATKLETLQNLTFFFSLILFLQNSGQLLKITVFSPYQLIPLPISTWQTFNS